MRARLLALASALLAAGAGSLVFINRDTGRPVDLRPGVFEILDQADCSPSACGANLCVQADNVLADAGSACRTRLVTCDNVRIGAQARAWAADAGLTLGTQRYQTIRFVGLRCPGADGGFAFGIPMDDAGLPQFASVAQQPPPCVRAPLNGGRNCSIRLPDGGSRFFGTGNVFASSLAVGSSCEAVSCRVMYGDNPDTDL